jgi:hypothetical protein
MKDFHPLPSHSALPGEHVVAHTRRMQKELVGALPHENVGDVSSNPQTHIRFAEAGYHGDLGHKPGPVYSGDLHDSLRSGTMHPDGGRTNGHQPELPLGNPRSPSTTRTKGQQFAAHAPIHTGSPDYLARNYGTK